MGAKAIKLCSCDKSVRFIKIYVNHPKNGVVWIDRLILFTKNNIYLMLVVKLKKMLHCFCWWLLFSRDNVDMSVHFMGKMVIKPSK